MSAVPESLGENPALIGMVAAFPWEVRSILQKGTHVTRFHSKLFSLRLGGEQIVMAISGAGPQNAFRAACDLANRFSLRGLASVGFAGGLIHGLKPGDVVVCDRVLDEKTQERFDCQINLLPARYTQRGNLLSVTAVVSSSAQKLRLGHDWGAVAVDMESAGVARAAVQAGLSFCAIKSITDSAEQSLSIDFDRCRSDDNGLSVWAILGQGITNAQKAKDLWRLAWSSRQASCTLASAMNAV